MTFESSMTAADGCRLCLWVELNDVWIHRALDAA